MASRRRQVAAEVSGGERWWDTEREIRIRARVDRITVFHDRSDIGADNALTLRNVQRTHEGNYSCHVKNSLGSDEIVYTLQVQGTWSLVVWEENKIPSSGILRPSGSFGDNFSRYSIKEGIPFSVESWKILHAYMLYFYLPCER